MKYVKVKTPDIPDQNILTESIKRNTAPAIAYSMMMLNEQRGNTLAAAAFTNDPLVRLPQEEARRLYDEMIDNTKHYLQEYFK